MLKHLTLVFILMWALTLSLSLGMLAHADDAPVVIKQTPSLTTTSGILAVNDNKKSISKSDSIVEYKPKSLLFSEDDVNMIHSARLFYKKNNSGVVKDELLDDGLLEKLKKTIILKEDSFFTYPQFFLSSIIYRSPEDWVVWVNNKKITKNTSDWADDLRVLDIDKEKIVFEWQPKKMDKIVNIGDYSTNSPIKVDLIRNKVVFSLKPNQTFTSYAMQIVEGRVPAVTINLNEAPTTEVPIE